MSQRISLVSPVDGATDISVQPSLTWAVSPAAPTNLQLSPFTANSSQLSWNESIGALNYRVYIEDELFTETPAFVFTITELEPNMPQNIGVSAVNDSGESAISYITSYNVGVAGLSIISLTDTELVVGWQNLPEASSYRLWSTEASYDETLLSGITQATLSIVSGNEYTIHITADIDGVTTLASELVLTIPLSQVQQFIASGFTSSSFTLTWAPVTNADGYRLWDVLSDEGYEETFDASTLSKTFSGVEPATGFSFNIVATKGTVESAEPAILGVVTSGWVPALNLSTTVLSSTSIRLNWNNISATSYQVFLNGAFVEYISNGATLNYTFTGLPEGQTHTLGLRAYQNTLVSNIYTIQATASWAPYLSLWATNNTGFAVTLNWSNGAADSYNIYLNGSPVTSVSGSTFSYTFTGLTPDTSYVMGVTASKSGFPTTTLRTITVQTTAIIWAFNIHQQGFSVRATDYTGEATYYEIHLDGSYKGFANAPLYESSFSNLISLQTYNVTYTPKNSGGFVGDGVTLAVKTTEWPLNPSLADITSTSVRMNFSYLLSNQLDNYTVFLNGNPVGTVAWGAIATYVFTGLTPNTLYTFGVRYSKNGVNSSINTVQGWTL
jgi:hypothetical protein